MCRCDKIQCVIQQLFHHFSLHQNTYTFPLAEANSYSLDKSLFLKAICFCLNKNATCNLLCLHWLSLRTDTYTYIGIFLFVFVIRSLIKEKRVWLMSCIRHKSDPDNSPIDWHTTKSYVFGIQSNTLILHKVCQC